MSAHANWLDNAKKKLGIGYQNYDECIIGELRDISPENKDVVNAIKRKCNKDFPLPKAEIKTLYFDISKPSFERSVVNFLHINFYFDNNTEYYGSSKLYWKISENKNNEEEIKLNFKLKSGNNKVMWVLKPDDSDESLYYDSRVRVEININQRPK